MWEVTRFYLLPLDLFFHPGIHLIIGLFIIELKQELPVKFRQSQYFRFNLDVVRRSTQRPTSYIVAALPTSRLSLIPFLLGSKGWGIACTYYLLDPTNNQAKRTRGVWFLVVLAPCIARILKKWAIQLLSSYCIFADFTCTNCISGWHIEKQTYRLIMLHI